MRNGNKEVKLLLSNEAGSTLFLTSLLPLGVWLFDSRVAALSFLTLSLYSSVIQNTTPTISTTAKAI